MSNGSRGSGKATYEGLRKIYYEPQLLTSSLLKELFLREPSLIDDDFASNNCRRVLTVKCDQYRYKDELIFEKQWFTISANNRYLATEIINPETDDNIRDKVVIDFSNKLFNPVVNCALHSIKIGDYTLYYDHPFFFNLTIMLLMESDNRWKNGYRLERNRVKFEEVFISSYTAKRYKLSVDLYEPSEIIVYDASYTLLDDFNDPIDEHENELHKGRIKFRIVDGRTCKSDDAVPSSISDLLGIGNHDYVWPSIAPGKIFHEEYLDGLQFRFIDFAEDLTILGDLNSLALYVCRTKEGWGGIKIKLSNLLDYHRVAGWLIIALSTYGQSMGKWDSREQITRYWPTFFE